MFAVRTAALILAATLALAACETMKGAGQDLETAGEAVQQSSTEVQQGM